MKKAQENNTKIYLPQDSVIRCLFADAQNMVVESNAIDEDWMGLDIGPKAIATYTDVIMASKTILWNGPMGDLSFHILHQHIFNRQSSGGKYKNGGFSWLAVEIALQQLTNQVWESEVPLFPQMAQC